MSQLRIHRKMSLENDLTNTIMLGNGNFKFSELYIQFCIVNIAGTLS